MFRCSIGIGLLVVVGCGTNSGRSFLPHIPGYPQEKRQLIVLDKAFMEISGMFYLPDGRIASIDDEEGKIFLIKLNDGTFESIKFAGKGDYEDVVKKGEFYYVLESNGDLHKVTATPPFSTSQIKFKREKKLEFESIYIDEDANKIILVTKDHRNAGKEILAYSYNIATEAFEDSPYYRIPLSDVYAKIDDNSGECKPSAAAVHPLEHKIYIVASIGKTLLKCSMKGKVEQAFRLNPAHFPQPEGITFAPNGDMYISNEGAQQGKATILKFPYVHN